MCQRLTPELTRSHTKRLVSALGRLLLDPSVVLREEAAKAGAEVCAVGMPATLELWVRSIWVAAFAGYGGLPGGESQENKVEVEEKLQVSMSVAGALAVSHLIRRAKELVVPRMEEIVPFTFLVSELCVLWLYPSPSLQCSL